MKIAFIERKDGEKADLSSRRFESHILHLPRETLTERTLGQPQDADNVSVFMESEGSEKKNWGASLWERGVGLRSAPFEAPPWKGLPPEQTFTCSPS